MLSDKTLLITGGTGSFGNVVLSRFADTDIKEIRIFSRDEKKQDDMRNKLSNDKIKYYIGDVRDLGSVQSAMIGVDYVFHAAALKQVPSCEFYPQEAVKTNINGTENVVEAAILQRVKRVVVLSTDKAVYPINAMGLSKAMAEKIAIAKSRHLNEDSTTICVTRYGNVMASRGSVIPLFIKQIIEDKPITITDHKMTRFLMSLDDSVELVMHAFTHGRQGDLFVQKAPASTIGDLAAAIADLFNTNKSVDIIGTRHGEKLYETLVSREEMARVDDLGRYYRVPADTRHLNYKQYLAEGKTDVSELDDYTSHNTERLDVEKVKELLLTLPYVRRKLNV